MKYYRKDVDLRSKKAMITFLTEHFRYNTLNAWNNSTSYAHNMKVYKLPLSNEEKAKLYDLLECNDFWREVQESIDEFARAYDREYTAGFNGRSGGYLVLYCSTEKGVYPARSIDQGEAFEDWTLHQLQERVKLVQEFDALADAIVETARWFVQNYEVVEETVMVETKIKTLKEVCNV